MTRVGLADTWISYSPHLLPRASGLGPWLTETGIGSANCNLVSLHVSFIIHCSSSKGGWEKKTNMIAELLIPKKRLNSKELSNCISAVVEGRAWGWCSNWVFICQGATCIFILRRSPPFSARTPSLSGSSTQFNGIFAQKLRVFTIALALQSTTHEQTLTLVMRNKKCHNCHMAKCTIQQPRGKILPLSAFLLFRSHSQQHRQSQAKK